MSTLNPFDLLEDVESDDPSLLIAATEKKIAAKKAAAPAAAAAPTSAAKLPTKPLPPAQAVKEARNNSAPARGGRGGAGRGGGRGGRGYGDRDRPYRDYSNTNGYARGPDNAAAENGTVASGTEEGERGPRGPRGPYRGGPRRGGYGNGEEGEEGRPRRTYDRHSGTGRGFGMKKDGAGRANWGTTTDENPAEKETEENVNAEEKLAEKEPGQDDVPPSDEAAKDKEGDAEAEKEEDKEMTLEEYEKVLEEKRKALLALKAEERKVEVDKELQAMQVLSVKKNNDEVFIKLGADKESKKKESEEKAKKSLSINDFLKPAEGESFYGRGRGGRGGRGRGGFRGDGGRNRGPVAAPSIADQSQFPSLGGK